MNQIYKDNQEITIFFNKAQYKIAQLAGIEASEQEDELVEDLLLELSNFLESLDSPYCYFTITDCLRYIHYFNRRAKLSEIPFIQITDYYVNINFGSNSPELGDLTSIIWELLRKFPHNSLAQIQGGKDGERYHISKQMYDWVMCQMSKTPCPGIINPVVFLNLRSTGIKWPSGYYELGTIVNSNILQGGYELNSGKSVLTTTYKKDGIVITGTKVIKPSSPIVQPYTDTSSLSKDTSYSFEVEFEYGGVVTDTKYIKFLAPMFFGILRRNNITNQTVETLTKDVREGGNIDLTFNLPEGNTLVTDGTDYTPVVEFPASFGIPKSVSVGDYDFIDDWVFTKTTGKLANGQSTPVIRGVFTSTFEGQTTFNFKF
jgi:hypothetical protein